MNTDWIASLSTETLTRSLYTESGRMLLSACEREAYRTELLKRRAA